MHVIAWIRVLLWHAGWYAPTSAEALLLTAAARAGATGVAGAPMIQAMVWELLDCWTVDDRQAIRVIGVVDAPSGNAIATLNRLVTIQEDAVLSPAETARLVAVRDVYTAIVDPPVVPTPLVLHLFRNRPAFVAVIAANDSAAARDLFAAASTALHSDTPADAFEPLMTLAKMANDLTAMFDSD